MFLYFFSYQTAFGVPLKRNELMRLVSYKKRKKKKKELLLQSSMMKETEKKKKEKKPNRRGKRSNSKHML